MRRSPIPPRRRQGEGRRDARPGRFARLARRFVGFLGIFLLVNLLLSLLTFNDGPPAERVLRELKVLWFSPPDETPMSPDAFANVYGSDLGSHPDSETIKAFITRDAQDGRFVLDHVLINHIVSINGRVDARSLPAGVYVGAHALGPDGMPWVAVTKYLAHYFLFPRHSYILIVPEEGPAWVFSASQAGKFRGLGPPERLAAIITPYDADAYDFPSSGQALHEMTAATRDLTVVQAAPVRLQAAVERLRDRPVRYGLLSPNSNTVVGCLMQEAGLISEDRRKSWLLSLRAPGFGASCERLSGPLERQPPDEVQGAS
jgi:hypothetical protein